MKIHDLLLDSRSPSILGVWGNHKDGDRSWKAMICDLTAAVFRFLENEGTPLKIHWTEWSKREGETFEEKTNFNLVKRNKIKLDPNFPKKYWSQVVNHDKKMVYVRQDFRSPGNFSQYMLTTNNFFHHEYSNSGFTKKWHISFKVILLLSYQRSFKIE